MELLEAWLDDQGQLDDDRAEGFRDDIAALLYPSAKRALALNVAYREIVREQSFIRGRDATIVPQGNVHREVTQDRQTGVINPERPWYGAD